VISDLAQLRDSFVPGGHRRLLPKSFRPSHVHDTHNRTNHSHNDTPRILRWSASEESLGRPEMSSASCTSSSSRLLPIMRRSNGGSVGWVSAFEFDEPVWLVILADDQMSVYLSSPSCPAFLPLLHGLLTASLIPPPSNGAEVMTTRMTCAMALVRFVNGMVDPLQTGKWLSSICYLQR